MPVPTNATELRAYCRGWPPSAVQAATSAVLCDSRSSGLTEEALAALIAAWLLDQDESEPPPLTADAVREIWQRLSVSLH